MKALRIPCFVLLLLLALSLANTSAMSRHCRQWVETLDAAQQAAVRENWAEADDLLAQLQKDMASRAIWLHITMPHTTVDETDRLLEQARLMCRLGESAHVNEALSELRVLLLHTAENERLSLANIL